MKWFGAIIIISTTTWFGFDLSKKLRQRKQQIRAIIKSIQILEAEMSYSSFPLQHIFENVSRKVDEPINQFYRQLSERLKGIVSDFTFIWEEELLWLMKNSALKAS